MNVGEPATRLHVIVARRAPRAVVFRRGPSRRVALILWRTDSDTFEVGQWLKGRIYERRCDLSPSGERLVYFAANWKPHRGPRSWTAVSRPPWLTAITLWPKGDAWGGGGLFQNETTLLLNHRRGDAKYPSELAVGDGFKAPPRNVTVKPLWEHSGWGEDDPIFTMRATRDGWRVLQEGVSRERSLDARVWCEFDPPTLSAKTSPRDGHLELHSIIRGMHERDGAWYLTDHGVHDTVSGASMALGRSEWADWDKNGDLLVAKGGKLFRARRTRDVADLTLAEVADFSKLTFQEKVSPAAARCWR